MATYQLNASRLMSLFLSGAATLEANKNWINDLNVFPVPDGDTGTNMTMTVSSAVKELGKLSDPDMQAVAKAISFGSLRGARGNSGVILSQLFRGFCKVVQEQSYLDVNNLSEAVNKAVETAYKAVMKPKEGTILTVARGMAEYWTENAPNVTDLEALLADTVRHGEAVLAQTPEMLPVLKEAGVVDSGGQGLIVFLKGAYSCLMGQEIAAAAPAGVASDGSLSHEEVRVNNENLGEITFGYCTEFLINLTRPMTEEEEHGFKSYLESLGDSIVMVADEEICKVHVHTNDPGLAIQKALTFGGLTNMKIDNMRFEHEEKLIRDASRIAAAAKAEVKAEPQEISRENWKEVGFVVTAAGKGLAEIFRSLNTDVVVEGGQTMNPSTEDLLDAIGKVPAHTVFVFPNNKNIVLAAQQAREMTQDKKVIVIPTATIPEGISCLVSYDQSATPEENEQQMMEVRQTVRSAEVTYSVRATTISGKKIRKGDVMGLGGPDGLYAVGRKLHDVTVETVAAMMHEDASVISVYSGADVTDLEAGKLADALTREYPGCDVELYRGDQPVYYYIISVE
ncbi:MAG: DAK2 domain-containing protein [Lachnospiraceae bacterium]|nr:DAK2 domain-containing protein [Lachnospiraceae bacterium]